MQKIKVNVVPSRAVEPIILWCTLPALNEETEKKMEPATDAPHLHLALLTYLHLTPHPAQP